MLGWKWCVHVWRGGEDQGLLKRRPCPEMQSVLYLGDLLGLHSSNIWIHLQVARFFYFRTGLCKCSCVPSNASLEDCWNRVKAAPGAELSLCSLSWSSFLPNRAESLCFSPPGRGACWFFLASGWPKADGVSDVVIPGIECHQCFSWWAG